MSWRPDRPSDRTGWRTRLRSPLLLRRLALGSVIANVLIVVTGGAVRLTSSGLGCPTWPKCTDGSLTPTKEYAAHGIIEFTNRQLTFVLSAIVLATLIVALLAHTQRLLAVLLAASIPAQAVLGGVTVLTHLNPWAVAAHFLLSMAIIAVAFALWWRVRGASGARASRQIGPPTIIVRAALGLTGITASVLAIGTVVTGSGPHAGTKGATNRIHWAPSSVSQLHADVVMLLIGATVAFVLLVRAAGGDAAIARASRAMLGTELAQGVIGFVQYFTGVPAVLVGFHMLGACLVWLSALNLVALCAGERSEELAVKLPRREDRALLAG